MQKNIGTDKDTAKIECAVPQSELIEALGGTTLRDNFAMAAMGIARLQEQWREEKPVSAGRIAARAYAIADAMMAARDK